MVGVDGHQVADLPGGHFPHGQVGGGQLHDFIVNLGLEKRAEGYTFVTTISVTTPDLGWPEASPTSLQCPHAVLSGLLP